MIIFWLLLFIGLALLPFYFFFLFLYHLIFERTPPQLAATHDQKNITFITKDEVNKHLSIGTHKLKKEGDFITKSKVNSVYLIHGSFVGDDPMHIISFIEQALPGLSSRKINQLKRGMKKAIDLLVKDLGNFSGEYYRLFENITRDKIKVQDFSWSSANNHIARVRGAIRLIEHIAKNHSKEEHILLVGHSHGGQIFALLSKLINNKTFRSQIKKALPQEFWSSDLDKLLEELSILKLDFVTLGTPARYTWELSPNMRLLHIINHRGETPRGGKLSGFFRTQSGDYIQQWGGVGSDMLSLSKSDQILNQALDEILGSGLNLSELKKNIYLKNRLHNQGHHLLVDYNDQSFFPNCIKTIFGHGIYTKLTHLSFHLSVINQFFYHDPKREES